MHPTIHTHVYVYMDHCARGGEVDERMTSLQPATGVVGEKRRWILAWPAKSGGMPDAGIELAPFLATTSRSRLCGSAPRLRPLHHRRVCELTRTLLSGPVLEALKLFRNYEGDSDSPKSVKRVRRDSFSIGIGSHSQ